MFGLFQDNTPQYAGEGQPNAYSGRNGRGLLGGLFSSSSTPTYATASAETAQTPAPVFVPSTGACASEQLPAQTECRVPLPCAIVIQRSDSEGVAIALTKLGGDQVATQ
jgi:hypothetical protein